MKSPVKTPTLSDLKAFIAVAEQRSFRRAADFSGVTRSTLSHAIRGLEARLGVRLLHRTTRSVALTEAGEALLRRISPHLNGLEQALEEIADTQGQAVGTLRINGGRSYSPAAADNCAGLYDTVSRRVAGSGGRWPAGRYRRRRF
jgi:DNA-binding transcriptional LysR family regulator